MNTNWQTNYTNQTRAPRQRSRVMCLRGSGLLSTNVLAVVEISNLDVCVPATQMAKDFGHDPGGSDG